MKTFLTLLAFAAPLVAAADFATNPADPSNQPPLPEPYTATLPAQVADGSAPTPAATILPPIDKIDEYVPSPDTSPPASTAQQ